MSIKEFVTAIAEISDVPADDGHPLLAKIKFIFATDEGKNLSTSRGGLKQGIKAEDFDEVIRTAVNAPIKMRYLGFRGGVGNHVGSIPIGHITKMEKIVLDDGVNALEAEAVLYKEEYPDEVDYLKTAYAANEAPGISYEVRHDVDKSIIENGVEWIKDLITQAATIVRSPAYGSRTAILALASNKELSTEAFNEEVLSIITPQEADKGGSNMDEKDKEITRLTALAAEKEEALTNKNTEVTNLTTELEKVKGDLVSAQTENETLKRTVLVESRAKAYAEAGLAFDEDAEKAKAKKELLAKMEDDVFNAYIADLKEAATKKTAAALASASDRGVPRLTATEKNESLDDLKAGLRGISRQN